VRDEALDDTHIVQVLFRVPLDSYPKGIVLHFDALNGSIKTPGGDHHSRRHLVDGLVVIDVPGDFAFPENLVEPAALRDGHGFWMENAIAHPIAIVADNIGEVLVEGSPQVNVQHLCAPANTKDGKCQLPGCGEEGVLERVTKVL